MDGIHEGESDGARLARMGTDAAAWAREMVETARRLARGQASRGDALSSVAAFASLLDDPAPGEWLHGWLCAAIEAGRAAGYSQGRQDATDRLHAVVGPWPIAQASEALRAIAWPLPEDSAGRTQPEDPAARAQPANLAGRDDWEQAAIAGLRASATIDPPPEPSPIARAADALEQIAGDIAAFTRGVAEDRLRRML